MRNAIFFAKRIFIEMVNEEKIYGFQDEYEKVWKINRNIFKQARFVMARIPRLRRCLLPATYCAGISISILQRSGGGKKKEN